MALKSTLFAVLICAATFGASAGQVYKWVDPSGRVHFSDTPRPGWTPVLLKAAPSLSADAASPEDAAEDATEEGGDTASRERLRADECKRRKDQLDSYLSANKIVERDSLGKEKEYSQEERLQLIEQTQKQVTELCGQS